MPDLNKNIIRLSVLSRHLSEIVADLDWTRNDDSKGVETAVLSVAAARLNRAVLEIDSAGGLLGDHFIDQWDDVVGAAIEAGAIR